MKIEIHIDDRLVASARRVFRRRNLVAFACVAVLGSTVAIAAVPHSFTEGGLISAAEMNANFLAATTAQGPDGQRFSLNATYQGSTAGHDFGEGDHSFSRDAGTMGHTAGRIRLEGQLGYRAAKRACEIALDSDTAHMCTAQEMARSAQLGVSSEGQGLIWMSTALADRSYGTEPKTNASDCQGWTVEAQGDTVDWMGAGWNATDGIALGRPTTPLCQLAYAIACCD